MTLMQKESDATLNDTSPRERDTFVPAVGAVTTFLPEVSEDGSDYEEESVI